MLPSSTAGQQVRVWAEPDAPAEAGRAVADEIASLARWLGASDVQVGERPRIWRAALNGL